MPYTDPKSAFVKQRPQIINALRGHLAEFGLVVAKRPAHVPHLVRAVEDPDEPIPELARPIWTCDPPSL